MSEKDSKADISLSDEEQRNINSQVEDYAAVRRNERQRRSSLQEAALNQALSEFADLSEAMFDLELILLDGDTRALKKIRPIGGRLYQLKNIDIPSLRAQFNEVQKRVGQEEVREPDVLRRKLQTLVDEAVHKKYREDQYQKSKLRIKEQKDREREVEIARRALLSLWNEQRDVEKRYRESQINEERRLAEREKLERPSQIRTFVRSRKITKVIHFTPGANLPSIVEHGFLSRTALERLGVPFEYTDDKRLDGYLDGLSVSIENKNDRMFYIKKLEKPRNWCIFELHSSVLWERDCAFFKGNAASSYRVHNLKDERRKVEALESMFEGNKRSPMCPDNCPDDVQAEVVVFDGVPRSYIRTIFTNFEVELNLRREILDLGIKLIRSNLPFNTNRRDFTRYNP